jgi:acetyl-CoA carboxylase biotin carboxyl carrier protein
VSLTAAEVAEIVKLVEQSSFDELTLEIDGLKLSLRRKGAGAFGAAPAAAPAAGPAAAPKAAAQTAAALAGAPAGALAGAGAGAPPVLSPPSPPAPDAAVAVLVPIDPNSHEVRSPLLGTFYRAPKPGAPLFVEVGGRVEEDTVVAIIEVMKLMNTVRAGVRGTVTDVLVSDGALVEFDQPLLRVRKSS